RRTAVWKAALWGGIAGTLPDLDVFYSFGNAVKDMTYHRSATHSLIVLTLVAPFLAAVPAWLHKERTLFKSWLLAMWLALITHPLLDTFTIYGTQLLWPLTEHPFGIGSMFIIDPLYTLPLLMGVIVALSRRQFVGLRWNTVALGLSCVYLAWSVVAQKQVERIAQAQLGESAKFFVTPTPLNTVAWRIVMMEEKSYSEGFYSFLDSDQTIVFDRFAHQPALINELKDNWAAQRMAWFTGGFYSLREVGGQAVLADLRMGQEPGYVFQFILAKREGSLWKAIDPQPVGNRGDAAKALPWLWARIKGQETPPPR
ncbi:MAG: metal-dependent hydrolase, partial [Brachymonas sp.]